MKIVALEEHIVTPDVRDAWERLPADQRDDSLRLFNVGDAARKLEDRFEERIRDMDASGIDVQVLSLTTPGVQSFDSNHAVCLARDTNDVIAATVRSRPDRFEGFATLPTPAPELAADELRRAVGELGLKGAMLCGRTLSRNLDHPDMQPIFAAAADLQVPLYIHPQIPSRTVRDAYYSGFGDKLDTGLATGGLGWHFETGVQVVRLILGGTFDRHPHLQFIVGHWGEVVLFYLERIEELEKADLGLERPLRSYFLENVYYTPSGFFSHAMFKRTIDIVGPTRMMFSTDYPFQFSGQGGARRFLDEADLGAADRERIAHGNWNELTSRMQVRAM